VESRAAQGHAFGAFLLVRVAGGAEVHDVGHVVLCVRQVVCWLKKCCLLVPLKKLNRPWPLFLRKTQAQQD
jgi:hypothetical protein